MKRLGFYDFDVICDGDGADNAPLSPEQRLIVGIIKSAICDILSDDRIHVVSAKQFFISPHFPRLCEIVRLDSRRIIDKIREIKGKVL